MQPQTQRQEPISTADHATGDDDRNAAPHVRMAAAIVEIKTRNGGCLPQDLNERGFTPAEVVRHWSMASSLAALKIQTGKDNPTKPTLTLRRK